MPPLPVRQALFVFAHPAVLDRNVLLLRTETTVGGYLLRTGPVPGSAAARSLLSSASAGIRLPTASNELPVSATTRSIRLLAPCAILLLPATSTQGAVTALLFFTRKLFVLRVMPSAGGRVVAMAPPFLLMSVPRKRFCQVPLRLHIRKIEACLQ